MRPAASANVVPEAALPACERPRFELGGILIDDVDLERTMERVAAACTGGPPMQIVTANLNFITLANTQPAFRQAVNDAEMTVVDGRVLLWLSRLLGVRTAQQVTGHDLVRECMALGSALGYRVFLLGGLPGVAQNLARRLQALHPSIRVEGADGGHFTRDGDSDQDAEITARIRDFAPHFLFVALGAPKQDLWIARHLEAVGARVAVGVGGVFDTLSGTLPRAPRWMQVAGLESPFQLLVAPRRYWRRYLLDDPPTLARVLGQIAMRRWGITRWKR